MEKLILDIKLRLPSKGLYLLALERIQSCKDPQSDVIKFPKVFSKLSASFSVPKERVWELLYVLHDLGLIKIHFGHGVSILYELEEVNKNSK